MAQVRLYHDCRTATDNEPASIRVRVSVDNAQTMISTGIKVRPDQWDKVQNQVVKHPQNIELTMQLRSICQNISDAIWELQQEDKLRRITSNKELRIAIENIVFPDRRKVIINLPEGQIKINGNLNERFGAQYLAFAATHKPSTRRTYMLTWRHICRFLSRTNPNGEEAAMRLPFEKIDHRWLRSFENYLAETAPSQNARSGKLRNIRAAFNEAINNNVTAAYPFRRYKVKTTATRKRSLTVEQLRQLFTMPVEPTAGEIPRHLQTHLPALRYQHDRPLQPARDNQRTHRVQAFQNWQTLLHQSRTGGYGNDREISWDELPAIPIGPLHRPFGVSFQNQQGPAQTRTSRTARAWRQEILRATVSQLVHLLGTAFMGYHCRQP